MIITASEKTRLLLVEDDPNIGIALGGSALPYNYKIATSLEEAKKKLNSENFDIALLDYYLGNETSEELFNLLKAKNCPFIIAIESGQEEMVANLINQGAEDYLIKDPQLNYLKLLPVSVKKVLSYQQQLSRLTEKENLLNKDITEKKQTEKALRDSEAELRHLLNNMQDYVFVFNREGRYVQVSPNNPQFATKIDSTVYETWEQDTANYFLEIINNVLDSQQSTQIEYCLYLQRIWTWFSAIVSPLNTESVLWEARNITKLKTAEESLKQLNQQLELTVEERNAELIEIQRRYQFLFNSKLDGVFVQHFSKNCNEEKFSEVNDAACQMLGYSREELLEKTPQEITAWRSLPGPEIINKLKNSGQVIFEAHKIAKNGRLIPAEVTLNQFEYKDQLTLIVFVRDIAERKRAELDLLESRTFLQTILDNLPFYVFWKDRNSVFLGCNLKFAQVAGLLSPAEIVGKTDYDLPWLPEKTERYCAEDRQVLESGQPILEIIKTQDQPDGSTLSIETNKFPLYNKNEIIGILGTFQDITERKRAESALLESRRFLQTVLDTFPLNVFWKDCHSVFLGCNLKFAQLAGLSSPVEIVGKTDYDLPWTKEESDYYRTDDRQVIESGQAKLGIIETLTESDGAIRWLETNKLPLYNNKGEIVGIVGTFQDITDRKRAEVILKETNQQLARATRLKDEFLANMSHELRTPLNAILGMTEALKEQTFGLINEQQKGALRTIERSGRHLLELINDILDLARIEAGQVEINYTKTNINQLCEASLSFIKHSALQKNIQLKVNISSHLFYLFIDERRMRQVLINLLNNAVKFTRENGSISLEVTQIVPDRVEIAVRDTGIGVESENLEKIFQQFIQIDSDLNRQYNGAGLGLTLVKKLVEMQGGQIRVSSKLGIGSCFTVSLPYDANFLSSENEKTSQTKSLPSLDFFQKNDSVNKYLVLLVEDNEANIVTISSYLKARGYHIIIAKNGRAAIEMTRNEKPNIILMDLQMPEINGLEAIGQIRSEPQFLTIPIIALTALAMQGDREKALELGANEYITKPVQLSQLAIRIQELLILGKNS